MCVALHFMLCKLINARKDVVINLRKNTFILCLQLQLDAHTLNTEHWMQVINGLRINRFSHSVCSTFATATHKIVLVVVAVLGVVFVVRA